MKKLRILTISLVMSISMMISLLIPYQSVSQSKPLAFDTTFTIFYISDLYHNYGNYTFSVDSISNNDTLFYLYFEDHYSDLYIYYGIIENVSNDSIKLKLHLETDSYINSNAVDTNGIDITGSYTMCDPMSGHFRKEMTISTNKKLRFDTLRIGRPTDPYPVKFSFSFTFTYNSGVGFNKHKTIKNVFKVYPNPCRNTLNVDCAGLKRIFDTSGRLIKESYGKVLDMRDLTPGMYVVMLEDGTRIKFSKY
jgi:hypothetical protein